MSMDLVFAIDRLLTVVPGTGPAVANDSLSPAAPFRVVNIGAEATQRPLMDFVKALETALDREAKKNFMEMQAGDVKATWADTATAERADRGGSEYTPANRR